VISLLPLSALALGGAGLALWRRRRANAHERRCAAKLPLGPDGVVRGAESIALHAGARRGVLLLHGFGDTPQTLRYLAEHLHRAGYTAHVPLLPGHGRTLREFGRSRAEDWVRAAREELEALRARVADVALVGLSMGGALAARLAAESDDLRALVLIAPYLWMPVTLRRLARAHLAWGLVAPYVAARGERSIRDPAEAVRGLAYGACTPRLLYELSRVVDHAERSLPRVSAPTLVIQSREDNRVAPAIAERALQRLGTADKRLVWVEGASHIVTVDYGRERVFAEVEGWIGSHMTERQQRLTRNA
jgi:carboxylesterase